MSVRAALRPIIISILACLGSACALSGFAKDYGASATAAWASLLGLAVALSVGVQQPRFLQRLRDPTPLQRRLTGLFLLLATPIYMVFANNWVLRTLTPFWHDDQMHVVQVRMLGQGRLWMPQHPLADFFETFHVFVKPIYAGIHFIGTTLLNVPGDWVGLPTYAVPLLISGITVAVTYLLVTRAVDGVAGLLAVPMLWSLSYFRFLAPRVTSHLPMLMLGLLTIWLWLAWRRTNNLCWVIAIGVVAGCACVTRPADAIAYLMPVAILFFADLWRLAWKKRLVHLLCGIGGSLPFLLLQLHFNSSVTGKMLYTPYQKYNDDNYPRINYATNANFDAMIERKPISLLPQKNDYYYEWLVPFIAHRERVGSWSATVFERIPLTLRFGLPNPLLYILVLVGFAGVTSRLRLLFALIPLLLLTVYFPHLFYLPHYAVIVAPSLIVLSFLGVNALKALWPRRSNSIGAFYGTFALCVSFSNMPPFSSAAHEDAPTSFRATTHANEILPQTISGPSVVLFKYTKGCNFHDEPVYNMETASPDDAQIIRAHDRGAANITLLRYYAEKQPWRAVWHINRATGVVEYRGTVGEALEKAIAASVSNEGTDEVGELIPWQT
ncbi:MAG: glycosyltransferase family 39 protein [Burkholderiales bacterium]|nr:glycosyltransferase family 39 protein [Phycisphaerae bacterium]